MAAQIAQVPSGPVPSGVKASAPRPCEVQTIITAYEKEEMGVVAAADALEDSFREMGLLSQRQIPVMMVGWDTANRNGEGGNPMEVIRLARDILLLGWSWGEVAQAICIEAAPLDDSIEVFNRKKCEGLVSMAPVPPNSIHFGSLACGHTNQALRAIAAGTSTDCPILSEVSQDGKLSVGRLRARDKAYAKAVDQGLTWKVLKHEVRAMWPKALEIIQALRFYRRAAVSVYPMPLWGRWGWGGWWWRVLAPGMGRLIIRPAS